MDLTNIPFKNIDLLSVIITIAVIGVLGLVVYANDRKSVTNKAFFLFTIVTIMWSFFNYINYHSNSPEIILWLQRIVIFLGVWHSYTFFQFFYVFPEKDKIFPKLYKFLLIPYVVGVSLLTLTPFVFSGIAHLSPYGSVSKAVIEKGIIVFIITVIGLIIAAIVCFLRKNHKAQGLERKQYRFIFIGTIITFSLLFTFNLILPIIFSNVDFIPFGALFIFPFIACTAYAICKHHLFNIHLIAMELSAFALWIFIASHIPFARDTRQVFMDANLLLVTLIFGLTIIRATLHEIRQRDKFEKMASDLSKAYQYIKLLEHPINEKIFGANDRIVADVNAGANAVANMDDEKAVRVAGVDKEGV